MVGVAAPKTPPPPRPPAPNQPPPPIQDPDVEAFHREIQAKQRAFDMALIREHIKSVPGEQVEPLAEVVRSSLTGLALWWLDRPDVPRAVLVDVMLRVTAGVLATAR